MLTETLAQHYQAFPCLEHLLVPDAGNQTNYSLVDKKGNVKLAAYDWVSTGATSGYAVVDNETVGHNLALVEGEWAQIGFDTAIWLIAGKFNGVFSFGFGDSTPNNHEVVFSQQPVGAGTTVYSIYKVLNVAGNALNTINHPTDLFGGGVAYDGDKLESGNTQLTGFITSGKPTESGFFESFITNTSGILKTYRSDMPDDMRGNFFPATMSMGADTITSPSGIEDLTSIVCFRFKNGLPADYKEALEWMRKMWAAGIIVIWPAWRGLRL